MVVAELAQGSASARRAWDGLSSPAGRRWQQGSPSAPDLLSSVPVLDLAQWQWLPTASYNGINWASGQDRVPADPHPPLAHPLPHPSNLPGKEAADPELPKAMCGVTLEGPSPGGWDGERASLHVWNTR